MEKSLLVEIGLKMLRNDCRGTSYPLYFISGEHFPKTFLSEQSAQEFCIEWGGEYNVASAHDNTEMIGLMNLCLSEALKYSPELKDSKVLKNAYFYKGE